MLMMSGKKSANADVFLTDLPGRVAGDLFACNSVDKGTDRNGASVDELVEEGQRLQRGSGLPLGPKPVPSRSRGK